MDDSLLVCGRKALAHLAENREDPGDREAAFALDEAREVVPVHELHREEPDALDLAEVVDPEHVPVRDAARELDLPPEAFEGRRVLGDLGADQLEGDVAVQLEVADSVDGPHPPAAE